MVQCACPIPQWASHIDHRGDERNYVYETSDASECECFQARRSEAMIDETDDTEDTEETEPEGSCGDCRAERDTEPDDSADYPWGKWWTVTA